MKKYLLFDLDGTLTDSKQGITACVQYALKAMGTDEPDADKLETFIGPPLKESFMQFYGMDENEADRAVEKYRERFVEKGIFENEVYRGIPAMLRTLQSKGMKLAVASSKPQVYVERILEHFHIRDFFEVVVGSELDGSRTKKDEVVQEALNRLFHYKPIQCEQVYMIGDRKFDMEGAKAHGIESVGVAYGYGSMEELKEAKADYIVRSVEELQKFLLRGTEEEERQPGERKANPTQRIWMMAMPFLMFLVVRGFAMNLLVVLFSSIGGSLPEEIRELIFVQYGTDQVTFSGSAANVIAALAYTAGALAIWPRAKRLIARMAEDTKLLHLKKEPVGNYVLMTLVTVGAVAGLNLLFFLTGLMQQSDTYQNVAERQYAGALLVGLVCYGVITPVAEELLFRGVLYPCLRIFSGVKIALPVSALLFGMYHMNTVQGMYGFLMGCIIAYGYEYFGSFRMAAAIHIGANLLAYCFTYTGILSPGTAGWVMCLVSLTVAAVSFAALHKRKNIF